MNDLSRRIVMEGKSGEIAELCAGINAMLDAMRAAKGIGLAAPQVGVPLRVCVIDITGGKRFGSRQLSGAQRTMEFHIEQFPVKSFVAKSRFDPET